MIKRLYFKHEHGDKDEPSSSSSSSSSDSEVEADDTESEGHSDAAELKQVDKSPSSSSGYESENSSADEINVDSSGCADEDDESEIGEQTAGKVKFLGKSGAGVQEKDVGKKDSEADPMSDYVMKFKSVYRCRLCPRIVCLTEATMKTHLNSKRHMRSEKLLKENRLKAMLNSDGEIENQETPAEMHARIMALAQSKSKKKNKGRQRQKKRSRNKKNAEHVEKRPARKRRKSESK